MVTCDHRRRGRSAAIQPGTGHRTVTTTILCADERRNRQRIRGDESSELRRRLIEAIRRQGGRVVSAPSTGGVVATFDAAARALAAALGVRAGMTDAGVRFGIETGDVEWRADECTGAAVDAALKLAERAAEGQIVVGESVRLLAKAPAAATYEPLGVGTLGTDQRPAFALLDGASTDSSANLPPAARNLASTWSQPFVGREAPLDQLERALDRARSGPGAVVLVGGDPGAGKTRLAVEFGRSAHQRGTAVLLGTCDRDLALPYQPWVEAVRQLQLPSGDPAALASLAPLAHLIPELEPGRPSAPPAVAPGSNADRLRVFDAFSSVLADAAARWPTVVVLDDLHDAGAQTLALLRHLTRTGLPPGLLVVGTFREASPETSDPLAACLADLRRYPTVIRLRLDDLDLACVERLVSEAVGHDLDAGLTALASRLWTSSGGNAFYLGELWRHLRERNVIMSVGGRWAVHGDVADRSVPESVREVVAARLGELSSGARRLIEIAGLAGPRFDLDVVARASGRTAEQLDRPLGELVVAGFVGALAAPALRYQFEHAIVRDTVAASISAIDRRRLHLALADALEHVHAHDRRPVLAELASHLVAASPLAPIDRTVYYARRAAARAAHAAAHEEAAAQLVAVLALDPPDGTRAQLLVDLAECRLRSGLYRQSRADSHQAFSIAVAAADTALAAEAALLFEQATHFPGLPGGPAVDVLRRAIELDPSPGASLRARLDAALGRALAIGGHDGAIDIVERAVAGATHIGDVEARLVGLQAVITASRDPARILSAARELEALATDRGDVWNRGYGCANQCRARIAIGDLRGAADDLVRLRLVNDIGRVSMFVLMAAHLEAILALAAGDLPRAEALAEQAAAFESEDGAAADGVYGVQLFAIRRVQGRLSEVAPALELLDRRPERPPVWRPGLAALHAHLGRLHDAASMFNALSPDAFAAVPRDALWPACIAYLAETCVLLGDSENAATLVEELRPFRGTNLIAAFTMSFGPADRLAANLLKLDGRPDEADQAFTSALDLARTCESPLWTAEILFDWATALSARDAVSAAEMRREAEELADSIGMRWSRPPGPGPKRAGESRKLPAGLSPREVNVLRLAAAGLSNRQIGERLFISQNTAANHMRAVLRKTGCANRTEATTFAHRAGIINTDV